jgi:hypothetical protein
MRIKLKDLRTEFYAYTAKTSEIFRQLSLAGIAIVWIFKKEGNTAGEYIRALPNELLLTVALFLIAMALDFVHAFIPSLILGIKTEREDLKGTDDERELNFPFSWTLPTWIFYISKVGVMVAGYWVLVRYLVGQIAHE